MLIIQSNIKQSKYAYAPDNIGSKYIKQKLNRNKKRNRQIHNEI